MRIKSIYKKLKKVHKVNFWLLLILLLVSCGDTTPSIHTSDAKQDYATGFRIDSMPDKTIVTILNPKDSTSVLGQFTLRSENYTGKLQTNEIKVPCKRIICLSSTQLAYLIELDALGKIVGINSSRFLFNKEIKQQIENGNVRKVGKEGVFNTELIAALNPDVIFVSPFKTGGYDALRNLGFPLVPMAAYSEQLPLGRAEWMKFMALFVGKTQEADHLFNNIANEYNRLKQLSTSVKEKPTVFSGKMKGGAWYVAGGKSFFAQMFSDAGGDYVIKNDKTGATPMDYESVYALAHNAKYWRLLTSSPNGFGKKMLKAEDERYSDFDAYKTGNVLICNLREIPYREESCVKPHVLLADYIHHFHPQLLPDHKPVYWTKIED